MPNGDHSPQSLRVGLRRGFAGGISKETSRSNRLGSLHGSNLMDRIMDSNSLSDASFPTAGPTIKTVNMQLRWYRGRSHILSFTLCSTTSFLDRRNSATPNEMAAWATFRPPNVISRTGSRMVIATFDPNHFLNTSTGDLCAGELIELIRTCAHGFAKSYLRLR